MQTTIDLSVLRATLAQLHKSMVYLHTDLAKGDDDLRAQFQTAAVKSFEYTYEMAIKSLARALETFPITAETLERLTFRDLIRVGAEKGLLSTPQEWFTFRDARNTTSHAYRADKATEIVAALPMFIHAVQELIDAIEALPDAS